MVLYELFMIWYNVFVYLTYSFLVRLYIMAVFYSNDHLGPNLFLLENRHNQTCFCAQCRQRCVNAIVGPQRREESLRHAVTIDLPIERQSRSRAVFEVTKKQIVYGKVYKDECMLNTRYKYFRYWAKRQPAYERLVTGEKPRQQEFDRHCQHVNEAAYCFENWEKIVSNLTDMRLKAINAINFTVRYFYLASSIDWCLEYNEKVRKKGRSQGELPYSSAQIDNIFEHIVSTGILEDIEYDEHTAASIGNQLQRRLTSYCRVRRARHHPYGEDG